MHAGQAARSGLTAALLAERGFTAAPDAITGSRGFCDLYDGPEAPDPVGPLGEPLAIVEYGVQVKKYPCCYFTHAAIAAAEWLREEHDLRADDVASVEVTASRGAADALHYPAPETGLEAKFSMQYPVAAALADGRVTIEHFDDENVDAPAVEAVRERTSFHVDESLPYEPFPATVVVETVDGETHERVQRDVPGTPSNPLSDAELREKFEMAASRVPAGGDHAEAYALLDDLRSLTDLDHLLATLSG
jgi:2-methylcitrate dehydratase PrpD